MPRFALYSEGAEGGVLTEMLTLLGRFRIEKSDVGKHPPPVVKSVGISRRAEQFTCAADKNATRYGTQRSVGGPKPGTCKVPEALFRKNKKTEKSLRRFFAKKNIKVPAAMVGNFLAGA